MLKSELTARRGAHHGGSGGVPMATQDGAGFEVTPTSQGEELRCGLACVAMFAQGNLELVERLLENARKKEIRKTRLGGTFTGPEELGSILKQLKLPSPCIRFKGLEALGTPCGLLPVRSRAKKTLKGKKTAGVYHWIVVTKVDRRWFVIDPKGPAIRTVVRDTADRLWTEAGPDGEEKPYVLKKGKDKYALRVPLDGRRLTIRGFSPEAAQDVTE